jgi:hypothetical protein
MSADSRSNSASTATIVPHFKLLERYVSQIGNTTDHESRRSVRSVSLVGVGLDNDTMVDQWTMSFLVFALKVGVKLRRRNSIFGRKATTSRLRVDLQHGPYRY